MRFNRKGKKNGPRVKTKPGVWTVSYCPECGVQQAISEKTRTATCKNGHKWVVR